MTNSGIFCVDVVLSNNDYSDAFGDALTSWADQHGLRVIGNKCDGARICFYEESKEWALLHCGTEISVDNYKFEMNE